MITKQALAQFYGTTQYYRHPFYRRIVYTDGVKYITDNGGAWLIDAIASHIASDQTLQMKCEGQINIELRKSQDESATLTACRDTDEPPLFQQFISWTDYPLESQKIWASFTNISEHECGWVLFLPSEY